MKYRIGIIGSNNTASISSENKFAFELGKTLVDNDYTIINGGMGGIMEASAHGASISDKFENASVIGFLPLVDKTQGNKYSGITIASDIGSGRNRFIILNSDAIIAIGGGAGTLNEIILARELGKQIAALTDTEGWSGK